ncbi:MAG TPA: MFS transporter [Chloroflexia bacterium]|nr:MFS transporter [Chloroflexia bacterium]
MAEAAAVPSAETSGTNFRDVLSNRNFLYLWIAQLFSQLAQQMINFALVLQVSNLTNASATATAGIIICFTLPAILFSAIAGVFVERASKKQVLVITNVARGVSVLFYILTVVLDRVDPAWALGILYLNTFLFSAVSQFFAPAEASMIPLLVKRDRLISANALFNLTFTAAQLIGFVFLGPLLLKLIGFRWMYIVLFAFYALSAWLTWKLPEVDPAADDPGAAPAGGNKLADKARATWVEFREGFSFIRADAALVIAIIYWSVAIAVFMMMATIGPKFLKDVLQVDPEHLYFILVPGGIGLICGVVAVGRVATEGNRPVLINYSMMVAGVGLLIMIGVHDVLRMVAQVLGQAPFPTIASQMVIGGMAFLLGIANSFISVPAQTVLQERAPETIRARVFAAFYTVSNVFLILPLVIVGAAADLIGVVPTVVAIGVLVLIVAALGLRYQQSHRGVLTTPDPAAGIPGPMTEPESLLAGNPPAEVPHAHALQAEAARIESRSDPRLNP